ncbi:MAG: CotH protein [Firmicutes bacterium ADurb.Bin248]|nr:MAG: CotH protein [Firmicutes bacterium ADurb.Bin248]
MRAYFRRRAALLLICALLAPLLVSCGGLPMPAEADRLFISEVVSSNDRSLVHERLGTPDWVELYNASGVPLSLEGCGLSDNLREPHKWEFPDVTIAAGGYLVVYCADFDDAAQEPLCTGFGISKGGETLILSDKNYNLIAQLALPALAGDVSYAMRDDKSYGYCASPTPGAKNDRPISDSIDTLVYETDSEQLALSEVLPENRTVCAASDGGYYPYAELYNGSSEALRLSSFFLTDDEENPEKWRIEGGTLLPGEYALVVFTGTKGVLSGGELCAPFGLGSEDTCLIVYDSRLRECARLSWDAGIPDGVSVTEDGRFTAFPTPGAENSEVRFESLSFTDMAGGDPVRINEVLVSSRYGIADEDGDRGAWVELANRSDALVSLGGYYLSDDEKPFKWALPDRELAPGGYLLVFLSGKDRCNAQLHASFRLSRGDGMLSLSTKDGMKQDRVRFEPEIGDDISVGRDAAGEWKYFSAPTPLAQNATHAFDRLDAMRRPDPNGVYISEVSAVGAAKGGDNDWVELYNGSDRDMRLEGWHLSDDFGAALYSLANVVVPAGGYALVDVSSGADGVPFSVSASGETLFLTNGDGVLVDAFETGALASGVTSGRILGDESGTRYFFTRATPKAANAAAAYPSYVMEPVFSERALYHDAQFFLTISCGTQDAKVYYTLDGSTPNASSRLYTEPIAISKNTPVRAVAIRDGLLNSRIVNATFLFETPHALPVVCLSMDKADFDAVYSVVERKAKVERGGGSFEYFEADGRLGISLPCGLRVNGASTLTMRQKSLSVYFRGAYGASEARYRFFADSAAASFASLVLRNSGQNAHGARLKDSFCMRAVSGLNIEAVSTRPVAVYVNGAYWGLYDLNENQNEDFLAAHYGVNPDETDIIRRNETVLAGARTDFKRVRAFALGQDTASDQVYAELCRWIDADCFTDYLIAQTYFVNSDLVNQKYWRSQDYAVKWRPVYFDLDGAFSSVTSNLLISYFTELGIPSPDGTITNMDIYVGLYRNAAWRERFCKRYVYVVVNQFDPDRLIAVLDELAAEMEPEMARHIARWGTPSSLSRWKSEVESIRNFLRKRPDYALKNLKTTFGLSDATLREYIELAKQG